MKITIKFNANECTITTDDNANRNMDPAKAKNDDSIQFGDVVGFKTLSNDLITGIVIDIGDSKAGVLYYDRFDERFDITYNLFDNLKLLSGMAYPEITKDVVHCLAN